MLTRFKSISFCKGCQGLDKSNQFKLKMSSKYVSNIEVKRRHPTGFSLLGSPLINNWFYFITNQKKKKSDWNFKLNYIWLSIQEVGRLSTIWVHVAFETKSRTFFLAGRTENVSRILGISHLNVRFKNSTIFFVVHFVVDLW